MSSSCNLAESETRLALRKRHASVSKHCCNCSLEFAVPLLLTTGAVLRSTQLHHDSTWLKLKSTGGCAVTFLPPANRDELRCPIIVNASTAVTR